MTVDFAKDFLNTFFKQRKGYLVVFQSRIVYLAFIITLVLSKKNSYKGTITLARTLSMKVLQTYALLCPSSKKSVGIELTLEQDTNQKKIQT